MRWRTRTVVVAIAGIVLIVTATTMVCRSFARNHASSVVALPKSDATVDPQRIRAATHRALLESPYILVRAAHKLNNEQLPPGLRTANDRVEWIQRRLKVSPVSDDVAQVSISSDDGTTEQLQQLANCIVDVFKEELRVQEIHLLELRARRRNN